MSLGFCHFDVFTRILFILLLKFVLKDKSKNLNNNKNLHNTHLMFFYFFLNFNSQVLTYFDLFFSNLIIQTQIKAKIVVKKFKKKPKLIVYVIFF
jgi:hypothetical protein